MYSRRFHGIKALNGARQFTFKRTHLIDVQNEIGRPQRIAFVKDLVAHDGALAGQALRCHGEA